MMNCKKLGIFLALQLTVGVGPLVATEALAISSKPVKEEKVTEAAKANDKAAQDADKASESKTDKSKSLAEVKSDAKTEITAAANQLNAKFDLAGGFSAIAEKVLPGVVNVSTTQVIEGRDKSNMPQFAPGSPLDELFKDFFDQMDKPRRVQSLGSGFVIKVAVKDGATIAYVVTNYHVIADAKKITVITHDNVELEATLQGIDERTDLAVLKINLDSVPEEKRNIIPLEWEDSSQSKVGDWVLAFGNPFGLGGTVTAGILSNISRNIDLKPDARSRISEYVDNFFQHDASINKGNSGGALVNLKGNVIGINTAIFSPSGGNVGIGFAIPASLASETVKQLIEFGRTKRGWLGVRIQNVSDDMAESYGLGKARGAIVASVTPKGPAVEAGIEPGDIILQFNGKDINEKNRLSRIVGETEVGKSVPVKLWRKGKEVNVTAKLGEFETSTDSSTSEQSKGTKSPSTELTEVLGLKLSKLTASLAQQFQIGENVEGIVVVNVSSDSAVASSGLRPGDVITEANQTPIKKPEDFINQIEEAKKNKRQNMTLLVNRRSDMVYITIKLEDDLKDKTPAKGDS
ncbi:Do family serine endopeptidase [Candidatus Paracaedibacter symbiosus]|uniref:Do family serine endopeptidase n=1 Tax=Candidatus Paracaedibacter symbiosus TaxID=244582 RepID=UPI00068FA4DA|nr:Do family serine endopeptidase [Candidatus Paracaedibacter symbiosus]